MKTPAVQTILRVTLPSPAGPLVTIDCPVLRGRARLSADEIAALTAHEWRANAGGVRDRFKNETIYRGYRRAQLQGQLPADPPSADPPK